MTHQYSKTALFVIIIVLAFIRLHYTLSDQNTAKILTWDAFGYYLYLPGQFIYGDLKKMDWVSEVNNKYQTTGSLYQLSKELPNGNRAIKYFLGISLLYSPFFGISHLAAGLLDFPQDGFSTPYQIAICLAAIVYAFLGLWVLRFVLLRYFSDSVTAITLLLVALGTNYVQYVSVNSGMSHGFIFTLYAFLLAATVWWHDHPTFPKAFLTGLLIGLGILTRPTEAVMLFIPFLFGTHHLIAKKEKWHLVNQHPWHVVVAVSGCFLAFFPQLLYWKIVTGDWVYDVGSKWTFLQPNWQVLFGWEKGWFVYTPIAILMVAGIYYLRKNPFYWSVLIYFILNAWIVTAWDDWRYGASYSSRALVQSYAVMSLPLAMVIQKLFTSKVKYIFLIVAYLLIFLNLFQVWQYNKGILHYDDMNRRYYQAIFLNPNPTPLQMSLLDSRDYISNKSNYRIVYEIQVDSQFIINVSKIPKAEILQIPLDQISGINSTGDQWLHITVQVLSAWGAYETNLSTQLLYNGKTKQTDCRMQNGISKNSEWNDIEFYFRIPSDASTGVLKVYTETKIEQDIFIRNFSLKLLQIRDQ